MDAAFYDVIFIGTPIWWYTMALPVRIFSKNHNLSQC
ncbi:flavodoxin [Pelosinus propionicus]